MHNHLQKICSKIREIAPLELGEKWDNIGLLVEAPAVKENVNVLLTNDFTLPVFDECIRLNVGLIISYHPPLFGGGYKRLSLDNWKENIIIQSIHNGISIYSPHTALDSCKNGVNDWLAQAFSSVGYSPVRPFAPITEQPEVGAGRIIQLSTPVSLADCITLIKQHLNLKNIRVATLHDYSHIINTVGICAGSGASLFSQPIKFSIDEASKAQTKIDLYLTGEAGHHFVLDVVMQNSSVILTEHSNSERGYLENVLFPQLRNFVTEESLSNQQEPKFEVFLSKSDHEYLTIH